MVECSQEDFQQFIDIIEANGFYAGLRQAAFLFGKFERFAAKLGRKCPIEFLSGGPFNAITGVLLRKPEGRGFSIEWNPSDSPEVAATKAAKAIAVFQEWLAMLASPSVATHSEDFTSVNWFGQRYDFSKTQACVIRLLWAEWEKGGFGLNEKYLGQEIGSDSDRYRLIDTFRRGGKYHPAWDTLIKRRARGVFGLQPPTERA